MTGPGPAARLRDAADLLEGVAAAASPEPWASPRVRAALVPWVALMSPDLGGRLAELLRSDADAVDEITAQFGATEFTADEWPALAVADVLLNGGAS